MGHAASHGPLPVEGSFSVADAAAAITLDQWMERASVALAETRYFEAAAAAWRALLRARAVRDFERMARICLPLQEARRQIRQLATDAAQASGNAARLIRTPDDLPRPLAPGCYVLQPPLIGADARTLREIAERSRVPTHILVREPLTLTGRWPIVGVGAAISVRAQVPPPRPLSRVETRADKDGFDGPVPLPWFEAAAEALGDAAIARAKPAHPAQWQVDDLLEGLQAVPDHERLHQCLAAACRRAATEPEPQSMRPSPLDNPFSF